MGLLKEYSTLENSYASAFGFIADDILTSQKFDIKKSEVLMSTLGISTTGLSTAKKIILELVKHEKEHGTCAA